MRRRSPKRWLRRLTLLAVFAIGIAITAGAAWGYRTLPLRTVEVSGTVRAAADEVVELAALPDSVALSGVDVRLVADRVQRHPWVRSARVRRLPTGTLEIKIEERTPVALVIDGGGRPRHLLDPEGHELPLAPGVSYDVPLLRGAVPEAPATRPVPDPSLVELLRALSEATPEVDALISEVVYRPGDVTLRTTPVAGHPALAVRLGAAGFAPRLERLRAFYDQAVLPRPGHRFDTIDLRFDGQVVTREAPAQAMASAQ